MVNFDDEFSTLLSNAGHLVPFFDAFFGFLYRRTDFFILRSECGKDVGFSEGVNEKVLLGAFNRWKKFSLHEIEAAQRFQNVTIPTIAQEVEVSTTEIPDSKELTSEEGLESKSCSKKDEAESFNGADNTNYRWSQTISDLDVTLPVDSTLIKGNQLIVDVKRTTILVKRKDTDIVLLNGTFQSPIKPLETFWNLLPGQKIQLNLEKLTKGWWTKLLTSENKHLNTSNLQIEQHVEDMTSVDKMAIEEAMLRQSKKVTENEKLEDVLRSAWNQEGSPFVGQPFDPSILQNIDQKH